MATLGSVCRVDRCRQRGHFGGGELAPVAGAQAAEREGGDADTDQALDLQADGGAHAADLALPARLQDDAQAAGAARARRHGDADRAGDALFEADAAAQRRDRVRRQLTAHEHVVLALVAVARMQHAHRPVAVVGHEQHALRVGVEASDRIEALNAADEIDDRLAAVLVGCGAHDAGRFVQQHVALPEDARRDPVDLDARVRPDLRAERRHERAVHHDVATADELFRAAA